MHNVDLTHHFLIAMPAMVDPYFSKTLVFVCEHNADGALGIIVNRPLDMPLGTLFEKVDVTLQREGFAELPVYFGGPVQTDRGFVLHRPLGIWQSTLRVSSEIGLTSSRDILQSIGAEGEPSDIIVTLGYSGWSAGQLENEISQNAWLTVAAEPSVLFEMAYEDRLLAAMEMLGVSFTNLSDVAGHA
jgi:putative transcriptional regulator